MEKRIKELEELLKDVRVVLILCTLIDKSGQAAEAVKKIEKTINIKG